MTSWWRWCITLRVMALPSVRCWQVSVQPMRVVARGGHRIGRLCRCSTWTMRCGNVRIWVTWPITTVGYPGRSRIGKRCWPACRSGWNCQRIGRIRRLPVTKAPGCRSRGRPNCSAGSAASPGSIVRHRSWWFRPPWLFCCRNSVRVLMWLWASRWQTGWTLPWTNWSVSSSILWCCGWICPAIRQSGRCWSRFAIAASPHSSIKTCRSKFW
nr:hypothetical protein CPGR_00664 [Mycolicibacterium fortuitum subsp. fortuitum DSM 46621 = ATCC 6841 = JCM 6387]